MSWLEPIDPREARRMALALRDTADDVRDDLAERVADAARRTRRAVEPRLAHATEVIRHDAPIVADAAVRQARRVARAAKADPVPYVVGAIGIALVASLVFGRRRT